MAEIFPLGSWVVNLGQGKYCVDTREYIGLRARLSINSRWGRQRPLTRAGRQEVGRLPLGICQLTSLATS